MTTKICPHKITDKFGFRKTHRSCTLKPSSMVRCPCDGVTNGTGIFEPCANFSPINL